MSDTEPGATIEEALEDRFQRAMEREISLTLDLWDPSATSARQEYLAEARLDLSLANLLLDELEPKLTTLVELANSDDYYCGKPTAEKWAQIQDECRVKEEAALPALRRFVSNMLEMIETLLSRAEEIWKR